MNDASNVGAGAPPAPHGAKPSGEKSTGERLIQPKPEVVLLLDEEGRILRCSDAYAGERLRKFDFRVGTTPHNVLHARCDGNDCEFVDDWVQASKAHRSGLPVEWFFTHHASSSRFKLRLQPVGYACGILFGNAIERFDACSVLFVKDISRPPLRETPAGSSADVNVRKAAVYELRRSTDADPDLVASLDDRLRTITGRLLVAQETERKRIAAELHDGLGQSLSLMRYEIEECLERARTDPGCKDIESLRRLYGHAKRALQELRDTSQNLKPTVIAELGLSGSIRILCSDFRAAVPGVKLRLQLSGGIDKLPDELGIAIYRIAQEALNNVARHANAGKAELLLALDDRGVELKVSDDGDGFEPTEARRRGLGLITMRERAETIGGEYEIRARPGGGCTLSMRWPTSAVQLPG